MLIPGGEQPRADPEDPFGADVEGRLRPALREQAQDPGLVGRQLVQQPDVGGVALVAEVDGSGGVEQRRRQSMSRAEFPPWPGALR
ncbi:MAG TPA: hypothetical protein VG223_04330 [Solirubrobacteraceae bacterium]|nr:hypothetical protein [Solirubrobacteraceae bacterium]